MIIGGNDTTLAIRQPTGTILVSQLMLPTQWRILYLPIYPKKKGPENSSAEIEPHIYYTGTDLLICPQTGVDTV